jgi:KaiC/GvpD/RAD55 family RecA-like ATPase
MNDEIKIKEYLAEKGMDFRESEDHFQLDCFLCTDTRKRLGIHKKTGQWHCFNCESKGSKLSTFQYAFEKKGKFKTKDDIKKTEQEQKCRIKPNFHLKFHKAIAKTKENDALRYLIKERGLTKDAVLHFKLGSRTEFINKDKEPYDAGEHVAIPYIKDGKCVNIKYRSLDPEIKKEYKWKREKGGISALYNNDVIDNLDYKEIYIAESELDAVSLWVLGIKNVIGLTVGAKGFKQEWYERLERFEKIYLVLDNDNDGQEGAKKLAKRLGLGRCINIVLPDDVKDPNDFLLKHDLDLFKSIVRKSRKFDVEDSVSLRDAIDTIYYQRFIDDNEDVVGYETQYNKLNKILGPLKPGYMVVVAAKPKVGKTTLALNWMKHWADNKIPVGMYQVEMRPERLAEKLSIMTVPDIDKIENATPEMIKEAKFKLPIDYMQFYYPKPGDLDIEKVCNKIREMVQRYGLKIFCFDNLHFLCRGDNENALIDVATQSFKLLAEELDIVFILITHPRKANNNKQLKNEDLKGSSSIYQDADVICLINRKDVDGDMTPDEMEDGLSESSKSPRADFKVTSRWHSGGKTFLAFHEKRSLFSEKGMLFGELVEEIQKEKGKKRKSGGF